MSLHKKILLNRMKIFFIILFLSFFTSVVQSQSPFISLTKPQYNPGDTLSFDCNLTSFKADSIHFASLYLFIERIEDKKRWSFRYPVIDGISSANLVIDSSMANGRYAFNFLAKKQFFSIRGNADKVSKSELNYSMLTKNNNSFFGKTTTNTDGDFLLKGLLFEDTCYFIFSSESNTYRDNLTIKLATPLDSVFVSDTSFVQLITIGHTTIQPKVNDSTYQTDIQKFFDDGTTLPGVTVTTVMKKKVELFDAEFSTGLFKNGNARIFDGIESNTIAQSQDILSFLQGRVAGLQVNQRNGTTILQWRGPSNFRGGSNVDVFLDEFLVSQISNFMINPSDVAMIKVYPPPAFLSPGGQKGAIAIYSKRGGMDKYNSGKFRFKVFGYTPLEMIWK
jgi:hypothetical protein